jgi:hypothetical protein
LREPNLGKTNPRVSLTYSLAICFAPSLADSFISLTLTRLVVVFIFVNFSFALFTPPLGDYQLVLESKPRLARSVRLVADDVVELNGDGAVEPREDNAVHEAPGARRRSVVVDEDVVVKDEPPQHEKDLSSPMGVVGRRRIQHHGHESPDVV